MLFSRNILQINYGFIRSLRMFSDVSKIEMDINSKLTSFFGQKVEVLDQSGGEFFAASRTFLSIDFIFSYSL